MATINIPYGNKQLKLNIPNKNLILCLDQEFPKEIKDFDIQVKKSLENPVAGPPFSRYLGRNKKIVILIDNYARLTPAYKILPPVIKMIKGKGAMAEILIANGALREMNEIELIQKLGDNVIKSGVPIYQSNSKNRWEFEFIGKTTLGTPVNLHRRFLKADASVAITMTQATLWGYGGGGSMILPGISSYETIEWNHRLSMGKYSRLGYEPPQNIMRADIEEALMMSGLNMSILVILNPKLEIINIEAGETIAAHRKSVRVYDQHYSFDLPLIPGGQLDIGISGSFSGDKFFAHSCWAIANLDFFVKDGGTIILCTPSPGGLAHFAYAKDYLPFTDENKKKLFEDFFYGKQQFWHGCLWSPILEVMAKKKVIVVTEKEKVSLFKELKIPAFDSAAEAFNKAMAAHGKNARVGFFPYGKWVIPTGLHN